MLYNCLLGREDVASQWGGSMDHLDSGYMRYEGLDKWLRCQALVLEVHGSNPAMTWLKITSLLSLPYRLSLIHI